MKYEKQQLQSVTENVEIFFSNKGKILKKKKILLQVGVKTRLLVITYINDITAKQPPGKGQSNCCQSLPINTWYA